MVLRFEVNQAEAFRRGVDVPKSTVHLEVDPSTLPEDQRNLIADRLDGIDVCRLCVDSSGTVEKPFAVRDMAERRIVALLPDFASLLAAIEENAKEVAAELARQTKSK